MTAIAQTETPSPDFLTVRYKTLFYILSAAPIGGLIALIDTLFLGGIVQKAMDIPINQILFLTAVLTFPHIIASLMGFADREYLSFYKKPLLKGIAISLGIAFGCKLLIDGPTILVIVALYSIYHNIMQQFGIAAMMLKRKQTKTYTFMKWMLVIPSGLAFMLIMLPFIPEIADLQQPFMQIVAITLGIATLLAVGYYFQIRKEPDIPTIGLQYFIGNIIWMHISYMLIIYDYGLMAILLSRIIHDFTAYWIYMIHDQNRNGKDAHNILYILPKKLGLKPFYMHVPIAIIISTCLISFQSHVDFMAVLISAFNLMHYYIEGHTWKRGTIHRQHAPFA